jgi:hypothetical protein
MSRENVLREGAKEVHQVKKCVVIGRVCTNCHQKETTSVKFENKKRCGQLLLITAYKGGHNDEHHDLFL